MIKVTVMYPDAPGARFDHAYYRERHMPMVARALGAACTGWSVDRGLAGGAPGVAAPFVALGHFDCTSAAAFQAAFAPQAQAILADVPNYTDIAPVLQISETAAA